MNAYMVKAYSVNPNCISKKNYYIPLGNIIIKKGIFDIKEICTDEVLKVVEDELFIKDDLKMYNEKGYLIVIKKKDFNKKVKVTKEIVNNYIDDFYNSSFNYFFNNKNKNKNKIKIK